MNRTATRTQLLSAFDALLEPARFKDHCPNGLQFEGKVQIRKVVSGVTASAAFLDAAIAAQADAVFVHHGLFWRGHQGPVTGWLKQRLAKLFAHDISLLAYHLPLDAHPVLGNNAALAVQLGFEISGQFGEQNLGCIGHWPSGGAACTGAQLAEHLASRLHRPRASVFRETGDISRIAWCTGGAQGYFESAIAAGADAFITGEISEPQAHLARECNVAYFACGHHATERYGAPAAAGHVAALLGIEHEFIDIDNPA